MAKTTSFLLKHSSTAEGDETTTTGRDPNQREKMGPYFSARRLKVRWTGGLRRWRWPIIGREGGLGGRFLSFVLLVWIKKIETMKISERDV